MNGRVFDVYLYDISGHRLHIGWLCEQFEHYLLACDNEAYVNGTLRYHL